MIKTPLLTHGRWCECHHCTCAARTRRQSRCITPHDESRTGITIAVRPPVARDGPATDRPYNVGVASGAAVGVTTLCIAFVAHPNFPGINLGVKLHLPGRSTGNFRSAIRHIHNGRQDALRARVAPRFRNRCREDQRSAGGSTGKTGGDNYQRVLASHGEGGGRPAARIRGRTARGDGPIA